MTRDVSRAHLRILTVCGSISLCSGDVSSDKLKPRYTSNVLLLLQCDDDALGTRSEGSAAGMLLLLLLLLLTPLVSPPPSPSPSPSPSSSPSPPPSAASCLRHSTRPSIACAGSDLGFGGWGLGFGVWGLGVWGLGFGVWG